TQAHMDGGEATVEDVLPGEAAVAHAARRSLEGRARGIARIWPFLGPAFIAAVAYVDPGNFATNIAGGAKFGYLLLWVILASNLMAMLIQSMSAKLGIATGMNLPEVCRAEFPRPVTIALWVQAELIAMATDLAEFIGAGLVNMSMLITAAAVFHANGFTGVDTIEQASHMLGREVGGHANTMFGIALLASGLSSSSIGTLAGQVVMQGFVRRSIPLFLRR